MRGGIYPSKEADPLCSHICCCRYRHTTFGVSGLLALVGLDWSRPLHQIDRALSTTSFRLPSLSADQQLSQPHRFTALDLAAAASFPSSPILHWSRRRDVTVAVAGRGPPGPGQLALSLPPPSSSEAANQKEDTRCIGFTLGPARPKRPHAGSRLHTLALSISVGASHVPAQGSGSG